MISDVLENKENYAINEGPLFEATFNQAAVGMAHISLSGQWLRVNKKICDIVGRTEEELLKITFQDITYAEDLSTDLGLVEDVIADRIQTYSLEKRYIKKDSSLVWINLTVSLVRDKNNKPLHFISVVENIHQRKLAEEKLARLYKEMDTTIARRTAELEFANQALKTEILLRSQFEDQKKRFFDISRDLMAIFGVDGILKEANLALKNLLGYSDEELAARPFIEFMHPDDLERTMKAYQNEAGRIISLHEFENRYICKDGSVRLLSWNTTPSDSDNCVYTTARDITDIRAKELQLHEQNLKIVASSRMESLGRMAAGIAHEINNPLTVIYGNAVLLQKAFAVDEVNKGKASLMCDRVIDMSSRIGATVKALTSFSRDSSNDALEVYSLKNIISETLSLCESKIKENQIELEIAPFPESAEIQCRPSEISQMLLNLLKNAKDAVQDSVEKKIRIELIENAESIGLAVIDSGSGIKREHISQLFQPFFSTKEVGKGTGLGLSLAKGIVDSHGGELYFDENSNETCFVALFPRINEANLIAPETTGTQQNHPRDPR